MWRVKGVRFYGSGLCAEPRLARRSRRTCWTGTRTTPGRTTRGRRPSPPAARTPPASSRCAARARPPLMRSRSTLNVEKRLSARRRAVGGPADRGAGGHGGRPGPRAPDPALLHAGAARAGLADGPAKQGPLNPSDTEPVRPRCGRGRWPGWAASSRRPTTGCTATSPAGPTASSAAPATPCAPPHKTPHPRPLPCTAVAAAQGRQQRPGIYEVQSSWPVF